MKTASLARLALADYRERTRRFGFLLTLGIALWAAYMFVPPQGSAYSTLRMGDYRGVYNSAWVGTLVSLEMVLFLGLAGFYLVKNTITRDLSTRVGELLAATRTSSGAYLLSKMLSNLAVLLTIVGASLVAAGVTQLIRGEATTIEPLALVLPFVLIALPMMTLVAALAVVFETVSWLRGGLGNVVYFFLWGALLAMGVPGRQQSEGIVDPTGAMMVMTQIQESCQRAFPEFDPEKDGMSLGINISAEGERANLETFEWHGIDWNAERIGGRLLWLGLGFALLLPARIWLDRSSLAGAPRPSKARRVESASHEAALGLSREALRHPSITGRDSFLSRAGSGGESRRFGGLVAAELRLSLQGTSMWWYLVALGLALACLFAPLAAVRTFLFPLAWIWPILKWSPLGSRERQSGTEGMLYSAPAPLWRQLPAAWFSGVLLAFATGSGMGLRWLVSGDVDALSGWFVGALFVPTLAVCLGSLSGSGKLFEILYLLLWYTGPLNATPALDYMGATAEAAATGMPWRYLAVTAVLATVALVAKGRRLRE